MNYALIKNGEVERVIVADDTFIETIAHEWDRVVKTTTAQKGWRDDGVNLTAPPAPPVSRKDVIALRLMEIDAISDKPRTRRELALNKTATKQWVQSLDTEAEALRTELASL